MCLFKCIGKMQSSEGSAMDVKMMGYSDLFRQTTKRVIK